MNDSFLLVYAFTLLISASWVATPLRPNGRVHSPASTTLEDQDSKTPPTSEKGNKMPDVFGLLNFSSCSRSRIFHSFFPSEVQMNISNYGEVKSSSNVMGVIRGSVEPGEAEIPTRVWRTSFPFSLCRQVRDLRQPQGQLGARRHRPEQRHVGDAGAEQSAGHEGQAG